MTALVISYGHAHPAQVVRTEALTWAEYVTRLSARPRETKDKAAAGWSIPALFRNGWRDSENLVARYALTLDYDALTRIDVPAIERAILDLEFLIYTTASHTRDKPRLRVVIPLTRSVSADEFQAVSRRVAARAGIELASRESHVPAQMMYLPTVKPNEQFKARHNEGRVLDPDTVLAEYTDWTDRSSWPRRKDGDPVSEIVRGVDPREKPGVVGEFCRTYTISQAIEKYGLPYEQVR